MFHLPTNEKLQRSTRHRSPRLYRNPIILAQEWQQTLAAGEHGTQADFARSQGISRARVTQLLHLLKLPRDMLNAIASLGDPLPSRIITERTLRSIIHRSEDEQLQEIGRILAKNGSISV